MQLEKKLIYALIILFQLNATAQPGGDFAIEFDKIKIPNSVRLDDSYSIAFSRSPISSAETINNLIFRSPDPKIIKKGKLTDNLNDSYVFLRFRLTNPTDSLSTFCFYPGYYMKSVRIFKKSEDFAAPITLLPDSVPNTEDRMAYRWISLAPHERSTFYVELNPAKIRNNILQPTLINPAYLTTHLTVLHESYRELNILTYILVGIMVMMVLFSFSNYLFTIKSEFLYYSIYALCTAVLLFAKTYLYKSANSFNYFFEEYLDFVVMLTGVVFYVAFVRNFLSTKLKYPRLDIILKFTERLLLLFLVLYSALYFLSGNIVLLDVLENTIKYFILGVGILFVVFGFRLNDRLMNYLVWGNLALVIFGMISLSLIVFNVIMKSIFTASIFYYDIGIVLELILFLFGLTYKNRLELIEKIKIEEAFKLEEEKREFEKQLAIIQAQQDERNRISADMHDELGGGMTAIRLMSELAKQRLQQLNIPEIEKISTSANDLLGKMNAIIWSMSPSNDSVANLVAYIRSYALEFFENTSIICHLDLPEDIPHLEMNGVKRRNIFLVVKESLNNIVKHSRASEVNIQVSLDGQLLIRIHDNGIGIDMDRLNQFGNGLRNMKKRMNSIVGRFYIEKNNGTITTMEVEL
ncbi:MAG: hypothetical protein C5B52_15600 [Bacteroidetes bacterium]|nr:MAG: hypothetical protein C5B52_15600 [Bacteroidota bacterium]